MGGDGIQSKFRTALRSVVIMAACAVAAPAMDVAAQTPMPIRMGASSNIAFGPNFVMQDAGLGIARKHGLELDIRVFATGVQSMEAAIAGSIDLAIMNSAVALPFIASGQACFKGPVNFIAIPNAKLVGRTDIKTVQDLAGKRVGTVLGASGNTALHLWLDLHKVPRASVTVVNVSPPDMPVALARGNVDAIVWTEPTPGQAIRIMGADKAHYIGDLGEAYSDVAPLNVTCQWAERFGDRGMRALVAAWIEAVEFVYANPERAAEITGRRLQMEPAEVLRLWREDGWFKSRGWGANLTDDQIDMLRKNAEYLISVGRLREVPDLSKWIDSRWLKAVAPDRAVLRRNNL